MEIIKKQPIVGSSLRASLRKLGLSAIAAKVSIEKFERVASESLPSAESRLEKDK